MDAKRTERWMFFSLGLNAALLAAVVWLVADRPVTVPGESLRSAPFVEANAQEVPPRELVEKALALAQDLKLSPEQMFAIEAAMNRPPAALVEQVIAMRTSRLAMFREMLVDPDGAAFQQVYEATQRDHQVAARAVVDHMRALARMLTPEQRRMLLGMLEAATAAPGAAE